jgi:hypothetical protein
VLSRSATATLSFRSSAMRRQRRLSATTSQLFCRTNGCPSFMILDPATGIATCPICGLARRVS